MHELSIAMCILDVAGEEADRRSGRVAAVHLRLGPLSGVVKAALVSAYELAREGTSLATSELIVEEVPAVAYCIACAAERIVAAFPEMTCPQCGTVMPDVISGRELDVFALEIEP